jgi:tripartite ATP-independent transporter DctM subunit
MLSLVALPSMIKRGYDKGLACGSICAGGCLGILIPPSIMFVIYGPMAEISVGKMFMGAIFPGLMLSFLYCVYILLRGLVKPAVAPPTPAQERALPFIKKLNILLAAAVPPIVLVLSVLGVIFLGVAPPTEAAAVGAFIAAVLTIAYRKFSWRVLNETTIETLRLTSMIFLIGGCSFAFVGVFIAMGCGKVVQTIVLSAPGGRWGVFGVVMLIFFILGFFMDWIGIVFIMVPILSPIVPTLGFDQLWFAMMVCVNLQMAFMTPPFAPAIFFLRGTATPELGVTMGDMIRGVIPFVIIIMVGLVLLIVFPEIILWLPSKMIK